MIKPSIELQELRRRIYLKAKAELAGRGGVVAGVRSCNTTIIGDVVD